MRILRLLLALSLALPGPALAHEVGRNDKLNWQAPCRVVYTDGDDFEGLKPHHCDFLEAGLAAEQPRFNEKMSLSQQRAFLMKASDDADRALAAFDKLLSATDPDKKAPEASTEGKVRKLVKDKALIKEQKPALIEPFGGKPGYAKPLDERLTLIDKKIEEASRKLDEKGKARIADFQAKLDEPGGTAAGLKKMDSLKTSGAGKLDAAAASGSAAFEKNTRAAGGAAQAGPGAGSRVGSGKGDQLAKGAAVTDSVQRGFQKDDFRKIAQHQGERLGDASQKRGWVDRGKELWSNVTKPAKDAPAAEPKPPKFSDTQIVAGPGVSKEAQARAKVVLDKMLEKADPGVQKNLLANNVKLVIVPKGGNLADYAPELKDQRTLDGRCFTLCYNPRTGRNEIGEVKAVADIPLKDGSVAALVPEENLIGKGPKDSRGFPKDFTTVHEFGHMVELYGLPKTRTAGEVLDDYRGTPDPRRVPTLDVMQQTFKDNVKTSGMDAYGKTDHREYFAQYSAAWFGKHNNGITAEELKRTDPKAYDMMRNIYGEPSAIG